MSKPKEETRLGSRPTGPYVVHESWVKAIGKFFKDTGWEVRYDPVRIAPSGSPVHVDLQVRSQRGDYLMFEFKAGDSTSYLPISAYAQAKQLTASGAPTVFLTNMKLSDSLTQLFQISNIPIFTATTDISQNSLAEWLKKAARIDPRIPSSFEQKPD